MLKKKNRHRGVEILIQKRANVNEKNRSRETPLHFAICNRNYEMTHVLIQQMLMSIIATYLKKHL